MDTGSEITAKIRSAIKAKLVELGAYVDDELPDYIMVMIANKKTKEQMANDLSLFLGKNSAIFTDWVHGVLDRLQAISQKATSTAGAQEKPKKEKREHRLPRKQENSDKSSPHDKSWPKDVKSSSRAKVERTKVSKRDESREFDEDRGDTKKSYAKVEETRKSHKRISPPRFDERDEVDLKADKELSKRKTKHEQQSSLDARRKIERKEEASLHTLPMYDEEQSREVAKVRPKKRIMPPEDELISESQKRRSIVGQVVQRKVEEEDYEIEYKRNTFSISSIVKVTERKTNVPSSMQPKPSIFLKALNEANASVSRLKSAIKRAEEKQQRRRVIEESGSPEEAEETQPIEESENEEDAYVPSAVSPLPSTNDETLNDDESRAAAVPRSSYEPPAKVAEYIPTPIQRRMTQQAAAGRRRVERAAGGDPSTLATPPPPHTQQRDDALVVDAAEAKNAQSTHFIVTLDGVHSSFVESLRPIADNDEETTVKSIDKRDRSAAVSGLVESPGEKRKSIEKGDANVVPQRKRQRREREIRHDRCETNEKSIDVGDRGAAVAPHASPEIQQLDTIGAGFEDDDDATTGGGDVLTSPLTSALATGPASNGSVSSQTIKEVKICLDTDDEEEEADALAYKRKGSNGQNDSANSQVVTPPDDLEKALERCKFWPSCKSGAACAFHHPTVPCKAFPTCRFGDRCLYVHPKCRYDPFCANNNCPFTHSGWPATGGRGGAQYFARPDFPTTPDVSKTPSVASVPPPCKFAGRCANPACTFRHPKPCAFGSNCLRSDCIFSHPILNHYQQTSVASLVTQKFKWVSPAARLS